MIKPSQHAKKMKGWVKKLSRATSILPYADTARGGQPKLQVEYAQDQGLSAMEYTEMIQASNFKYYSLY